MTMLADLHLHSTYSDGLYTPNEVCRRASANGVSLLSITDHDTLAGLEEKKRAAKKYGLSYVSGWEISAYEGEEKLHILGYGCEMGQAYYDFLEQRKKASFLRAQDSVEKLQAAGIEVALSDVLLERLEEDAPLHTMHVARAIAKKLKITAGEAYLGYLNRGKLANSNIGRPTPQEGIACIHACKGIAVVAHPGRLTLSFAEREKTLRRLACEGADGIECVYTTHTLREAEYFEALAKELGLLITGGSDTHFEEETHRIGSPVFLPSKALLERIL